MTSATSADTRQRVRAIRKADFISRTFPTTSDSTPFAGATPRGTT